MRHPAAWLFTLLLSACAAPTTSFVAPTAAGKPGTEVSKLVAASEANLFPCNILYVKGPDGSHAVDLGGSHKSDVTLPAGRYRVTLLCASGYHSFKPEADVAARAGKSYRITGYLVDDSITIFTMKMRVKVAELP
jgi:hypothetical protein